MSKIIKFQEIKEIFPKNCFLLELNEHGVKEKINKIIIDLKESFNNKPDTLRTRTIQRLVNNDLSNNTRYLLIEHFNELGITKEKNKISLLEYLISNPYDRYTSLSMFMRAITKSEFTNKESTVKIFMLLCKQAANLNYKFSDDIVSFFEQLNTQEQIFILNNLNFKTQAMNQLMQNLPLEHQLILCSCFVKKYSSYPFFQPPFYKADRAVILKFHIHSLIPNAHLHHSINKYQEIEQSIFSSCFPNQKELCFEQKTWKNDSIKKYFALTELHRDDNANISFLMSALANLPPELRKQLSNILFPSLINNQLWNDWKSSIDGSSPITLLLFSLGDALLFSNQNAREEWNIFHKTLENKSNLFFNLFIILEKSICLTSQEKTDLFIQLIHLLQNNGNQEECTNFIYTLIEKVDETVLLQVIDILPIVEVDIEDVYQPLFSKFFKFFPNDPKKLKYIIPPVLKKAMNHLPKHEIEKIKVSYLQIRQNHPGKTPLLDQIIDALTDLPHTSCAQISSSVLHLLKDPKILSHWNHLIHLLPEKNGNALLCALYLDALFSLSTGNDPQFFEDYIHKIHIFTNDQEQFFLLLELLININRFSWAQEQNKTFIFALLNDLITKPNDVITKQLALFVMITYQKIKNSPENAFEHFNNLVTNILNSTEADLIHFLLSNITQHTCQILPLLDISENECLIIKLLIEKQNKYQSKDTEYLIIPAFQTVEEKTKLLEDSIAKTARIKWTKSAKADYLELKRILKNTTVDFDKIIPLLADLPTPRLRMKITDFLFKALETDPYLLKRWEKLIRETPQKILIATLLADTLLKSKPEDSLHDWIENLKIAAPLFGTKNDQILLHFLLILSKPQPNQKRKPLILQHVFLKRIQQERTKQHRSKDEKNKIKELRQQQKVFVTALKEEKSDDKKQDIKRSLQNIQELITISSNAEQKKQISRQKLESQQQAANIEYLEKIRLATTLLNLKKTRIFIDEKEPLTLDALKKELKNHLIFTFGEELQNIENFDAAYQRFATTVRDEHALLSYLSSLRNQKLASDDFKKLKSLIGRCFKELLQGTFHEWRFQDSPHLNKMKEMGYEDVIERWKKPHSQPFTIFSEGSDNENKPLHLHFIEHLKIKLARDHHVNNIEKQHPSLFSFLNDTLTLDEALKQSEDNLLEHQLLKLCQEFSLKELENLLPHLQDDAYKQFILDIQEFILTCNNAQKLQSFANYRFVFSHDFSDLILINRETGGCLDLNNGSNNKALMQYIADGKIGVLGIKNEYDELISRRVVFILMTEKGPVILMQPYYSFHLSDDLKTALEQFGIETAKRLKLPLLVTKTSNQETSFPLEVFSYGGKAPFEYNDSTHQIHNQEPYSIDNRKALYLPDGFLY